MIKKAAQFFGWGVLVGIDKFGNLLLLGSIHKTISMRLSFAVNCKYVVPRYSWVEPFAKFVDWLFDKVGDKNHIWKNYEAHEVINPAFWPWYEVVQGAEFAKMEQAMRESAYMGRIDE